jgi:hypothetical protein
MDLTNTIARAIIGSTQEGGIMKSKNMLSKSLILSAMLIVAATACRPPDGGDTIAPLLSVQNIREGGVVHSGFLVGTVSEEVDLTAVEICLDGGDWQPATLSGSGTWTFQLPIGANTWRDGTAHTVAARATDASNNTGTAGPITVRKGVNRDVNGDGYEDVVVGAREYSSTTGRIYVFHSAGSAGVPTTAAGSASRIITGEGISDRFGFSVDLGDVNGDGYADVVVGATQWGGAVGRVYVFHSAGSAGVTITEAASASSIVSGEAVSYFGWSVATGDVNGDGYADVIVGAFTHTSNTGRVYVFHSAGSAGVTISGAASASSRISGEAVTDYLGSSVATGDVNGDGYADVIAGAVGYNPTSADWTGRVYVLHSRGASGVTADGTPVAVLAEAESIITGESGNNQFGYRIAAGDVNGDGYNDLTIGAPQYQSGGNPWTGRAYVFHSAGTAGVMTTMAASANSVVTGEAANDSFGTSVATGDVNGDGYADVIVGATGYSSNSGRAYVFHSAGTTGVTTTMAASANSVVTGEATGNLFGAAVAVEDVNGDSYADVVVGAQSYSSSTGRAYTFHSSGSTGITITAAGSASSILTGEAGAGQFGCALAGGY